MYLEDVPPLVVLHGPAEASKDGVDLVGAEEAEQAVQQHLQLYWNRVETLNIKTRLDITLAL